MATNGTKIEADFEQLNNQLRKAKKYVKDFNNEYKNTSKHTKDFNKAIQNISLDSFINNVSRATKAVRKFIDPFVNYIEDLNLLKVAFGDTGDAAKDLIDNIADVTGFDVATLTRGTATFRQLTSTLGATNEVADLLATNLEKMSLDLSSLYNVDLSRASYALQGALTGQPRSIKTITGADVTQDTLQAELARLGIDRKVRSLNQAETAIITYLSVERQLINSNGDLARTIEQPANMIRIFREQITRAARNIGNLFLPALKAIIPIATAVLMVFSEIVEFITALFGIDANSFWEDMSSGLGTLDDIGSGLDSITSSAQKAKLGLRGFDKLNVINTPSEGSSASGGSGSGAFGTIDEGLLKALDEYDLRLDNVKTKAHEIADEILSWFGFTRNANGELEWTGIKLGDISEKWSKLNGILKVIIQYGIYTILSKAAVQAGKLLTTFVKMAKVKVTGIFSLFGEKGVFGTWELWAKTATQAEKIKSAIGGIVSNVAGMLEISGAIRNIKEEGWNANNTLSLIIGTVELIAGGILIATSLVQAFGKEAAIATGGATALLGGIIAICTALVDNKSLPTTIIDETQKLSEEMEKLHEKLMENVEDTYAQASRVEDLKNKLNELVDENGKVKGSHEEVNTILHELNDIMGSNYQLTGDQITLDGKRITSQSQLNDQISDYINKLKAAALVEASREFIIDLEKKNLEKKTELKKLTDEMVKSQENYNLTSKEGQKQFLKDNVEKLDKIGKLTSEIETNNNQLELFAKGSMEAEKGHYDKAIEYMTSTAEVAKVDLYDLYNQIDGLPDVDFKFKVSVVGDSRAVEIISELAGKKTQLNITKKAEGGFVDAGQMFIAREAGPELVGRIGSRTAVANNDQIVNAVAKGVTEAIIKSGGLGGKTAIIKAEGDTDGLMKFIHFKEEEDDMQYGY